MIKNVDEKYGITEFVFFSSSLSSVLDANRAMRMCLNIPLSCASPTLSKNISSQATPLKIAEIRGYELSYATINFLFKLNLIIKSSKSSLSY